MSVIRSYRQMKWYTKLGLWGSVASILSLVVVPMTCKETPRETQTTTGPQSPIIKAGGAVHITFNTLDTSNLVKAVGESRPSTPAVQSKMRARYSEKLPFFRMNFAGSTVNRKQEDLTIPYQVFSFGANNLRMKVVDGLLSVDAELLWRFDAPLICVTNGDVLNMPIDWDMNSDESAMEIVNEHRSAILQLVHRDTNCVFVRGVFWESSGAILCTDRGMERISPRPGQTTGAITNPLTPIFRYPSYRFPGVRRG